MGPKRPIDVDVPLKKPDIYTEYQQDWDRCSILPGWRALALKSAQTIVNNLPRYERVQVQVNVRMPVYIVGLIHLLESDGSFTQHLHNGDPLSARTRRIPANRPVKGNPPFSWEESAVDALIYDEANERDFHDIPHVLRYLEGYNGMGYRKFLTRSPYLWSGTSLYTSGKFVRDNEYDPKAVSKQLGCVPVMKCFFELTGTFPPK
jgi:lysozyme family protein